MSASKLHFDKIIKVTRKIKLLHNIPLFGLLILYNALEEKTLKKNQILIQQGKKKKSIFVVLEGNCDMIFEHLNRAPRRQRYTGNHPFKIKNLGPGDYTGIEPLKNARSGEDCGFITGVTNVRNRLSAIVRSDRLKYIEISYKNFEELPSEIKVSSPHWDH